MAHYRKRWAAGTGHGMVKRALIMAHSRPEAVRGPCFVLSLAAHSARVMACAGMRRASRDGRLPQAMFRLLLISRAAGALAARPGPKPRPGVFP